jgi:hypothetical protein
MSMNRACMNLRTGLATLALPLHKTPAGQSGSRHV